GEGCPSARRQCSAALGRRRRWRRWRRRRRTGGRCRNHRAIRAGLRRRWWRWWRRRWRRHGTGTAHLGTKRHAEGPRLAQERTIKLRRSSSKSRLDHTGRAAALQRRVERDLEEMLVEQVLRPEF